MYISLELKIMLNRGRTAAYFLGIMRIRIRPLNLQSSRQAWKEIGPDAENTFSLT